MVLIFAEMRVLPAGGFTQLRLISSWPQLQICSQITDFFPHLGFLSSQQPLHDDFEKLVIERPLLTGEFVQKAGADDMIVF